MRSTSNTTKVKSRRGAKNPSQKSAQEQDSSPDSGSKNYGDIDAPGLSNQNNSRFSKFINDVPKNRFKQLILGKRSELFLALLKSTILHLGMIYWSVYHDKHFRFKYTDIDYLVFSDAARIVKGGGSPYERNTYRYSPVIAYLLIPNELVYNIWGKLLFSACNLVVGVLIYDILTTIRGLNSKKASFFTSLWLLNPFIIAIATRGSSDSIITAIICYILRDLMREGPTKTNAFIFAAAVSIRMYTIIYLLTFWLAISPLVPEERVYREGASKISRMLSYIKYEFKRFFLFRRVEWMFTSAMSFILINGIFYYRYSYKFLYETFLYHIFRIDFHHNLSPLFYYLYLNAQNQEPSKHFLMINLPQGIIMLLISFLIEDPVFSCFCQTLFFTAINKVSSAQYLTWYIVFVPIVLSGMELSKTGKYIGASLLTAWLLIQYFWNRIAYKLEYLGDSSAFFQIWILCLAFYMVNILILVFFMMNYEYKNQFSLSNTLESEKPYSKLKISNNEKYALEDLKVVKKSVSRNLVYTHLRGNCGVELYTIKIIKCSYIHKLVQVTSPILTLGVGLFILILILNFFNSSSLRIGLTIPLIMLSIYLATVYNRATEASLLYIPNTGIMIRSKSAYKISERFIHGSEIRSILIIEYLSIFKVLMGLVASIESDSIFSANNKNKKKLQSTSSQNVIENRNEKLYGHQEDCKLLSNGLEIVPLFPKNLCSSAHIIDIWRSLNGYDEKSIPLSGMN